MGQKFVMYFAGFVLAILMIGCAGGGGGGGTTTGTTTGGIPLNTILYKLLLANGDVDIRYARPDGSGSTRVRVEGPEYYASTPNGTQTAWAFGFDSNIQGAPNVDLYVSMNGTIGNATRLSFLNFADIASISWSPDGLQVAFIALDSVLGWGLYLYDFTTGEVVRLDDGAGSVEFGPDNLTIVYEKDLDDVFGFDSEICIIRKDGSGFVQLTDNQYEDFDPSWSHDGRRIVFSALPGFLSDIFMMNSDGTSQRNITNTPLIEELGPSFNPDDAEISFIADFDNNDSRNGIYRMNTNGTGRSKVETVLGVVKTYWWP